MICFAVSVLPAPDSPETKMLWLAFFFAHRLERRLRDGEDVRLSSPRTCRWY